MRHTTLVLLSILVSSACGGAPRARGVTEADLRIFTEAEALEIIREVMADQGISVQSGWQVDVGADEPLEVDVRLARSDFGVEWVSPQDRHDFGDVFPQPDPSGQLRILPGTGEDARAQILVLDHGAYRYDPAPERVRRGSIGAAEAEARLRRDLRDYLEYVRGQAGL